MPRLTEQVGGYLISWDEVAIAAKVSRLHVHQDGHITGMLAITHHRNGTGDLRLMPNTQINFSSEVTRAKMAKQLADKYGQLDCAWVEMFDYLGESVQTAALAGTPTIDVISDVDAEAPPLLIRPLLYQGHQNIIFGEKGVNKSTLAYALGIFLLLPETSNALALPALNPTPMRTLVLDWETDERTFRWYLGRLAKGLNCGPVPMFYRHCRLPLAQDIEPISEDIERTGAQLILIDSLGAAAGGELNDPSAALDFNAALRKLPGITSLIIAQTSKDKTGAKTVFGSHYFTYYARNIFELCREEEPEGGVLHVGLYHRECNFALKSKPMGIQMTYHDDGGISMEREAMTAAELVAKLKGKAALLATLREGPLDVKSLATALGWKPESVRPLLSRLKLDGKIIDVGDGRWQLTKDGY